jgi:hypothetical protein
MLRHVRPTGSMLRAMAVIMLKLQRAGKGQKQYYAELLRYTMDFVYAAPRPQRLQNVISGTFEA